MAIWTHPKFLRTVLLADAATCVATGLLMTGGSSIVAGLTHLPANLLTSAGLSLFPIAAFIAFAATRTLTWPLGVWAVIVGNIGWVVGSVWLLFSGTIAPNGLGHMFVLTRATRLAITAEDAISPLKADNATHSDTPNTPAALF
jgi:hypothetical protein